MFGDSPYTNGDVVWVKLGSSWWPGEVCGPSRNPEDTDNIKKKPFAIVKFFHEESFEYVKTANSIHPYNCSKKLDFIKRGLELWKAKYKFMEKFPADIETAERLTDGDISIIENITSSSSKSRQNIILSEPKPATVSPKPKEPPKNDTVTKVIVMKASSSDSTEKSSISQGQYKCPLCSFTSVRQNLIIMHSKSHQTAIRNPIPQTATESFKPKPKPILAPLSLVDSAPNSSLGSTRSSMFEASVNNSANSLPSVQIVRPPSQTKSTMPRALIKLQNCPPTNSPRAQVPRAPTPGPQPSKSNSPEEQDSVIVIDDDSEPDIVHYSVAASNSIPTTKSILKKPRFPLPFRSSPRELVRRQRMEQKQVACSQSSDEMDEVNLPLELPDISPSPSGSKNNPFELKEKLLADWNDEDQNSSSSVEVIEVSDDDPFALRQIELNRPKMESMNDLIMQPLPVDPINYDNDIVIDLINNDEDTETTSTTEKSIDSTKSNDDEEKMYTHKIRNIPKKDRRDIILKEFNSGENIINIISATDSSSIQEKECPEIVSHSSPTELSPKPDESKTNEIPNVLSDNTETVSTKMYAIPDISDNILPEKETIAETCSPLIEKQDEKQDALKANRTSELSCFDFEEDEAEEGDVLSSITKFKKKFMSPEKVREDGNVSEPSKSNEKSDLEMQDKVLSLDIENLLDSTQVSSIKLCNVSTSSTSNQDGVGQLFQEVRALPIKERGKRIFKSRNRSRFDEDSTSSTIISAHSNISDISSINKSNSVPVKAVNKNSTDVADNITPTTTSTQLDKEIEKTCINKDTVNESFASKGVETLDFEIETNVKATDINNFIQNAPKGKDNSDITYNQELLKDSSSTAELDRNNELKMPICRKVKEDKDAAVIESLEFTETNWNLANDDESHHISAFIQGQVKVPDSPERVRDYDSTEKIEHIELPETTRPNKFVEHIKIIEQKVIFGKNLLSKRMDVESAKVGFESLDNISKEESEKAINIACRLDDELSQLPDVLESPKMSSVDNVADSVNVSDKTICDTDFEHVNPSENEEIETIVESMELQDKNNFAEVDNVISADKKVEEKSENDLNHNDATESPILFKTTNNKNISNINTIEELLGNTEKEDVCETSNLVDYQEIIEETAVDTSCSTLNLEKDIQITELSECLENTTNLREGKKNNKLEGGRTDNCQEFESKAGDNISMESERHGIEDIYKKSNSSELNDISKDSKNAKFIDISIVCENTEQALISKGSEKSTVKEYESTNEISKEAVGSKAFCEDSKGNKAKDISESYDNEPNKIELFENIKTTLKRVKSESIENLSITMVKGIEFIPEGIENQSNLILNSKESIDNYEKNNTTSVIYNEELKNTILKKNKERNVLKINESLEVKSKTPHEETTKDVEDEIVISLHKDKLNSEISQQEVLINRNIPTNAQKPDSSENQLPESVPIDENDNSDKKAKTVLESTNRHENIEVSKSPEINYELESSTINEKNVKNLPMDDNLGDSGIIRSFTPNSDDIPLSKLRNVSKSFVKESQDQNVDLKDENDALKESNHNEVKSSKPEVFDPITYFQQDGRDEPRRRPIRGCREDTMLKEAITRSLRDESRRRRKTRDSAEDTLVIDENIGKIVQQPKRRSGGKSKTPSKDACHNTDTDTVNVKSDSKSNSTDSSIDSQISPIKNDKPIVLNDIPSKKNNSLQNSELIISLASESDGNKEKCISSQKPSVSTKIHVSPDDETDVNKSRKLKNVRKGKEIVEEESAASRKLRNTRTKVKDDLLYVELSSEHDEFYCPESNKKIQKFKKHRRLSRGISFTEDSVVCDYVQDQNLSGLKNILDCDSKPNTYAGSCMEKGLSSTSSIPKMTIRKRSISKTISDIDDNWVLKTTENDDEILSINKPAKQNLSMLSPSKKKKYLKKDEQQQMVANRIEYKQPTKISDKALPSPSSSHNYKEEFKIHATLEGCISPSTEINQYDQNSSLEVEGKADNRTKASQSPIYLSTECVENAKVERDLITSNGVDSDNPTNIPKVENVEFEVQIPNLNETAESDTLQSSINVLEESQNSQVIDHFSNVCPTSSVGIVDQAKTKDDSNVSVEVKEMTCSSLGADLNKNICDAQSQKDVFRRKRRSHLKVTPRKRALQDICGFPVDSPGTPSQSPTASDEFKANQEDANINSTKIGELKSIDENLQNIELASFKLKVNIPETKVIIKSALESELNSPEMLETEISPVFTPIKAISPHASPAYSPITVQDKSIILHSVQSSQNSKSSSFVSPQLSPVNTQMKRIDFASNQKLRKSIQSRVNDANTSLQQGENNFVKKYIKDSMVFDEPTRIQRKRSGEIITIPTTGSSSKKIMSNTGTTNKIIKMSEIRSFCQKPKLSPNDEASNSPTAQTEYIQYLADRHISVTTKEDRTSPTVKHTLPIIDPVPSPVEQTEKVQINVDANHPLSSQIASFLSPSVIEPRAPKKRKQTFEDDIPSFVIEKPNTQKQNEPFKQQFKVIKKSFAPLSKELQNKILTPKLKHVTPTQTVTSSTCTKPIYDSVSSSPHSQYLMASTTDNNQTEDKIFDISNMPILFNEAVMHENPSGNVHLVITPKTVKSSERFPPSHTVVNKTNTKPTTTIPAIQDKPQQQKSQSSSTFIRTKRPIINQDTFVKQTFKNTQQTEKSSQTAINSSGGKQIGVDTKGNKFVIIKSGKNTKMIITPDSSSTDVGRKPLDSVEAALAAAGVGTVRFKRGQNEQTSIVSSTTSVKKDNLSIPSTASSQIYSQTGHLLHTNTASGQLFITNKSTISSPGCSSAGINKVGSGVTITPLFDTSAHILKQVGRQGAMINQTFIQKIPIGQSTKLKQKNHQPLQNTIKTQQMPPNSTGIIIHQQIPQTITSGGLIIKQKSIQTSSGNIIIQHPNHIMQKLSKQKHQIINYQQQKTQTQIIQQLIQQQQHQQQHIMQLQLHPILMQSNTEAQQIIVHQQLQEQQLQEHQLQEQKLQEQQLQEQQLQEQQLQEQQLQEQQEEELREQQMKEQELHNQQLQELQMREQLLLEQHILEQEQNQILLKQQHQPKGKRGRPSKTTSKTSSSSSSLSTTVSNSNLLTNFGMSSSIDHQREESPVNQFNEGSCLVAMKDDKNINIQSPAMLISSEQHSLEFSQAAADDSIVENVPSEAVIAEDGNPSAESGAILEDNTMKILAVPATPVAGYAQTFILCTVVDNKYTPLDNKPMYLEENSDRLIPISTDLYDPNILPNLMLLEQYPKVNDECPRALGTDESQLIEPDSLQQQNQNIQDIAIKETENLQNQQQPINEIITNAENNDEQQNIITDCDMKPPIVIIIENQQLILDYPNLMALVESGKVGDTKVMTEDGHEYLFTSDMIAALSSYYFANQAAQTGHHVLVQAEDLVLHANSDILAAGMCDPEIYQQDQLHSGDEVLQMEASTDIQTIQTAEVIEEMGYPQVPKKKTALTSETNVLHQTPIMSTLEMPSNKTNIILNEAGENSVNLHDSLAAVIGDTPKSSSKLPITITNPDIAPKTTIIPSPGGIYTTTHPSQISPPLSSISHEQDLQYELFTRDAAGSTDQIDSIEISSNVEENNLIEFSEQSDVIETQYEDPSR